MTADAFPLPALAGREVPPTQRAHAHYLHARDAYYVLTVKGNQPGLLRQLKNLPWKDIPTAGQTHNTGHGRNEHRTIKTTTIPARIGFPHAVQSCQITRRIQRKRNTHTITTTACAITTLRPTGHKNIAQATRYHQRNPIRPLQTIMT